MRPFAITPGLLVLALLAVPLAQAGITWGGDVPTALQRAADEGRPILFAINALESEGANDRLCRQAYPSDAWGKATREYVCLVGNAGSHPAAGEASPYCTRYGRSCRCSDHQASLRYLLRRFAPIERTLISPQHIVLEPDGGLAYRKEYYTGEVGPELLERLFVRISPELTYEAAGDLRADRIEKLESAAPRTDAMEARAWLSSGDLYAAAGILRVIDFSFDDAQRLRLIETLDDAPRTQLSVLGVFAEEAGARPDDRPAEALALARSLLRVDRGAGTRLLARIACRTADDGLRKDALQLWLRDAEGRTIRAAQLPAAEQAALTEVLLLTGRQSDKATDAALRVLPHRLARAEAQAGLRDRRFPALADALEGEAAGALRGALLEADAADIQGSTDAVVSLLTRPERRVRTAAALALVRAKQGDPTRISEQLWEAVIDPGEGEETLAEAIRRLGEDPGDTWEAWLDAVKRAQAAKGGER